jgi:hypothetical protein
MADLKKVNRIDSVDPGKWMTMPFKKTDEGFLTGRAIVTSVGVFTYLNADGTVSRELRLPEEVFARDSLDSMKMKPLANDHPQEKITAENAKVYQVGSLGNDPSSNIDGWGAVYDPSMQGRGSEYSDGYHVAIGMTITDAVAVAEVEAGKTALSMGYICDIEPSPPGAVWCGMSYTGIQRNILYNHCAIVDRARAGDAARIRMDGNDAVQINQSGPNPKTNPEVGKMKKINIDGVEYEGEEKLVQSYVEQKNRADNAEKSLEKLKADQGKTVSALEGERDALKDRSDKLEKELKEARDNASDAKKINEAVNARLMLIDAATRAGVKVKEDMAEVDIRKAVITAVYPSVKLDGRDDAYITARFDAAVEDLDARNDGESRAVLGGGLPATGSSAGHNDSVSARQKMIDRMQAASRGEKKEA